MPLQCFESATTTFKEGKGGRSDVRAVRAVQLNLAFTVDTYIYHKVKLFIILYLIKSNINITYFFNITYSIFFLKTNLLVFWATFMEVWAMCTCTVLYGQFVKWCYESNSKRNNLIK